MGDTVIKVENLGKKYLIRHQLPAGQATLKDYLMDSAKALGQRMRHWGGKPGKESEASREEFWALKDVSFEVKQGDRIGIIGHNGAGKSTLLKILSRITEPTKGQVSITGRIASLLEVGTGFHPDLTGRENIYLNGAILGMSRKEIKNRFDEIVDFSEIEKFLDTPVKRYSSGMYVRLAFAVAAHLESEILIIDEVLAVGDTQFQKKCLGKMDDVAKVGKTILFVSHNMGVVQALCQRVILLKEGIVLVNDSADTAISHYLKHLEESSSLDLTKRTDRQGKGKVQLTRIEISMGESHPQNTLTTGYPANFNFYITKSTPRLSCSFTVYDQYGQAITNFDSAVFSPHDFYSKEYLDKFTCAIDCLPLKPGRYQINAALIADGDLQDDVKGCAAFDVVEGGHIDERPAYPTPKHGSIILKHRWIIPE